MIRARRRRLTEPDPDSPNQKPGLTLAKRNNGAAAKFADGSVEVRFSQESGLHAEVKLVNSAKEKGTTIVEIYSERQPCTNKCEALLPSAKVTWSFRWNPEVGEKLTDVRSAATSHIKAYLNQLFR